MIYIEEKTFYQQVKFLEAVANNKRYSLVIWAYPESELNEMLGFPLCSNHDDCLEPVTTYQEAISVRRTKPMQWEESIAGKIIENKNTVLKNVDSFCLYKESSPSWVCCTVGHEGMCLARDDKLLAPLKNDGFQVSFKPPVWW